MNRKPADSRRCAALAALGLLVLAACGGGGGYGSDPNPNPNPNPPPTGGITRTGVAVAIGPVTGFGSIIVNGVHYDTATAQFVRDDNPSTEDQLKVGHLVLVTGTIDDNNANAVAMQVEVDETVEGPVTGVDEVLNTFVALGQAVQVSNADTSIDDSCQLAALGDLLGVAVVEVFGPYDASGVIRATRIECKAAPAPDGYEVNGVVSGHDPVTKTFNINNLRVDYSATPVVDGFPTGAPADGDPVEAKGGVDFADGTPPVFRPAKVEYRGGRFAENEGDHIEVEGFITDFASATAFRVLGIPVTTNASTVFVGGDASGLGDNLKVEVEGEFNGDGVLLATRVEIKRAKNVRLAGLVDSADAASGSFVILGVTVTTDALTTRFEDKRDKVEPFGVADLVVDDYVTARGQEFPAGSGNLAALIVERDQGTASDTELRGFVEPGGVNRPTLVVLGVQVDATETLFRNIDNSPMAIEDFWAAVQPGSLIDIKGSETGTGTNNLAAMEIKLEPEDSP